MGQIFPGLASGVGNFFSLNWWAFSDFLTNNGGVDPVTGRYLLPLEYHEDFVKSTMEALAEKRKFGIQDFDDYLMEVWDFDFGGIKMLPKQSQQAKQESMVLKHYMLN